MNQDVTTLVIYVAVVAVIIVRQLRERTIKAGPTMFIFPILLIIVAALPMSSEKLTSPIDILTFVLAVAAGVALGYWQSSHAAIRVDRAAGRLYVKASPIGIAIFVVAFGVRAALRLAAATFGSTGTADFVSTAALFFAVGIFFGMRVYWQRAYASTPEAKPLKPRAD